MLGPFLKALRQRHQAQGGTKPSELIHRIGVPRSTFYAWEGPKSNPDPGSLQVLLDLYGATEDEQRKAWRFRSSRTRKPRSRCGRAR